MKTGNFQASLLTLLAIAIPALCQEPIIPQGEKEPLLRLEAGGPTTYVTALAFSSDGQTLYAAGFDKVVRVWIVNPKTGKFELDSSSYRVPIGPGLEGAVNAIALSPDGTWLAVAGMGVRRGGSGFRQMGLILPKIGAFTPEMRKDQGTIYLFNTKTRRVRPLRMHLGPVLSMAFAPAKDGKPPLLVSIGKEWDADEDKYVGTVRLWDANKAAFLDGISGLPLSDPFSDQGVRPDLTVWHTGPKARQLAVAFAMGDGNFRLWHADPDNEHVYKALDGRYNNTTAYYPAQGKLITGSMRDQNGRLQLWTAAVDQELQPDPNQKVNFATEDKNHFFPRALTLISSQSQDELDHAAVILRVPEREDEYRLHLVDLSADHFGETRSQRVVWKGRSRRRVVESLPVLASAPGGKYLAVAGNRDHEILVFSIADLLQNRGEPQILHSAGSNMRYVAFVSKEAEKKKTLGVVMNEAGKSEIGEMPRSALVKGDLIFDFSQRKLTSATQGWKVETSDLQGWQARPAIVDKKQAVTISKGPRAVTTVKLKANQRVTDVAIYPSRAPLNIPILAIAYQEFGEPTLAIYNGETGEQLRQFSGHTDPITSLAFSADGRLLASSGDDQTLCVWSLASLDKVLGKLGMLEGVAVKTREKKLLVGHVDEDSPFGDDLKKDDAIDGIVEGETLRPFLAPRSFYDYVASSKPGQIVTLRIAGKGDKKLKLGQGIDERKPLLSLFITRGENQEREWFGWNPNGPYDASGRKTERLFGWHFNTGKPEAPTSFALADQYRREYFREGILNHLVTEGSLAPALKAWEEEDRRRKLPRPKMTGLIFEADKTLKQPDARGQILVQKRPVKLMLSVDDFPLDKVESVQWQVNGGPLQEIKRNLGREWELDLSPILNQRGQYRVHLVLHTLEEEIQEYTRDIDVRFQPPPPIIQWQQAIQPRRIVAQPAFNLRAKVVPAIPNQQVRVHLSHRNKGKELADPARDQGLELDQEIKLLEGENLIEVIAENQGALSSFEEKETSRQTILATYQPPADGQVAPPIVSIDKLESSSKDGAEPRSWKHEIGTTVRVDCERLVLIGKIASQQEELSLANWSKGDAKETSVLDGFVAQKNKVFEFRQEVLLRPGSQKLLFTSQTPRSAPAQAEITIEFQPRLPRVVFTRPSSGTLLLQEGDIPPEVRLEARILPHDDFPFQTVILLNGRTTAVPVEVNLATKTLTAKFVLTEPGDNQIQVALKNTWSSAATSEPLHLRFVRPPRNIHFEGLHDNEKTIASNKALIDLSARLESPLPLTTDSLRAEINGQQIGTLKLEKNQNSWSVQIPQVPLRPGKNQISLWARNAEAASSQPGSVEVVFNPPPRPPAPPEIRFIEPAIDIKVTEPNLPVTFRVSSDVPLKKVELVREGRNPIRQSFPLEGVQKDSQGYYEFKTNLSLLPKENPLRVEAVNEGGCQNASVVANYLHMPVRLAVQSIEPRGQNPIAAEIFPNGKLRFPAIPTGRARLEGKVTWEKENDDDLRKVNWVRVYVNNFQQIPGELSKPEEGKRERTFTAELLLNRTEDNEIEIEVPNVKQESSNRRDFKLDCQEPEKGQRLHLLVVGLGEKDEKVLMDKAFQAIRAKAQESGKINTPAFEEVRVYGPLNDYVTPDQVFTQLCVIKKSIDLMATQGSANDVVMVYYEGGETIEKDGHFFLTSACEFDKELQRSAITCKGISNYFSDTLGAQILLLDVDRLVNKSPNAGGTDVVAKWADESYAGVLRYRRTPSHFEKLTNRSLLLTDLKVMLPQSKEWGDVVSLISRSDKSRTQLGLVVDQTCRDPLLRLNVGEKR